MDRLNIPVTGWSKNIPGFECKQHILDQLNRLRQWYMYTFLTGTLESLIITHRSITEIWNLLLSIFFSQIKNSWHRDHLKIDHKIHWTAANIQNISLDLKLKVLLYHDTFYILLVIHWLIHQIIFHLWFFSLFLVILKTFIYVKWGCGGDADYCSKYSKKYSTACSRFQVSFFKKRYQMFISVKRLCVFNGALHILFSHTMFTRTLPKFLGRVSNVFDKLNFNKIKNKQFSVKRMYSILFHFTYIK